VAEAFDGPYRTPPGGNLLAPLGHYAGRVCHWQGQDLFFCWHRGQNDWPGIRNPAGKFIVPPLALRAAADGQLRRRSFAGWDAYQTAPATPLPPDGAMRLCRNEPVAPHGWRLQCDEGFDILAAVTVVEDVRLTGTLTIDAAVGGLACRLDDDATGYFLRLTPGSSEVDLVKWLPGGRREEAPSFPWFTYVEVQRGHLDRPLVAGETIPFQLLAVGPYIELSLHGEVIIAAVTGERLQGRLGIWAETGAVAIQDALVAPMRRPIYAPSPR
jgi:beta-fructofuranosidase